MPTVRTLEDHGMTDTLEKIVSEAVSPAPPDPALQAKDEALRREIKDRESVKQLLNARVRDLMHELDTLRAERRRLGLEERQISDHAVVRYLERIAGLDIEAVRAEVRTMASRAVPFKNCDGLWDEQTQTVVVLGGGDGVVTILGVEQAEKYIGRRLLNGEMAAGERDLPKPEQK